MFPRRGAAFVPYSPWIHSFARSDDCDSPRFCMPLFPGSVHRVRTVRLRKGCIVANERKACLPVGFNTSRPRGRRRPGQLKGTPQAGRLKTLMSSAMGQEPAKRSPDATSAEANYHRRVAASSFRCRIHTGTEACSSYTMFNQGPPSDTSSLDVTRKGIRASHRPRGAYTSHGQYPRGLIAG